MDREDIIINYDNDEFEKFLINDTEGKILELFNDEGLNILKKAKYIEDKICYILVNSRYKNELFHNQKFLDIFLDSYINHYYAVLGYLDDSTYEIILNRCLERNKEYTIFATLFNYCNANYRIKKIEDWPYPNEILYEIIKRSNDTVSISRIIENYNIDLSNDKIDIKRLFYIAKQSVLEARYKRNYYSDKGSPIYIPTHLLTKDLKEKIWNKYDIYGIRTIINDAYYFTDATILNDYIKEKEAKIIDNYKEDTLLPPYDEIFEITYKYKQEQYKLDKDPSYNDEMYFKYRNEFYDVLFYKSDDILEDYIINENNIETIKDHLQDISNKMLSNYIIDYHFEENYHNIMLDLEELLNFYYKGNISIPAERAELYGRIFYIDYLTVEQKIELHNELKNYNMIELFYDDMSFARHIVGEAIKEYSLGANSIKKYKDEKLSKEYGVDVYNMDGEMFFGIVKMGRRLDTLPTGHSFSLIGHGCVATIGDVKEANTFLYDAEEMNPEQLVHAFPFDSYTLYKPFDTSETPTRRVNILALPDELVETTDSYNEILLLERGTTETDMDKRIPLLKKLALYCLDEIREQDVEKAKQEKVGIILINTKKYEEIKADKNPFNKIERVDGIHGYNYFNGFDDKENFEKRR